MRRLVFVVAVLGAAVLLAQPGSGAVKRAAASANTWSGTWDRAGVGQFDITQSGTAITGNWHWGTGGTLQGTLHPDGHVAGTWGGGGYSVTAGTINWGPLSADGKSFTGTTTYGGETRSWGGTCVGGACTNNGTATTPPPPVVVPPPVIVPAPSAFGTTITAAGARPGGTALITSPPLTVACHQGRSSGARAHAAQCAVSKVIATLSGISPGDLAVLESGRRDCYVNYTRAIVALLISMKTGEKKLTEDEFAQYAAVDILALNAQVEACVQYVNAVQAVLSGAVPASAAQAGCAFVPVTLSLSGSGSKARLRSFHVGSPNDKGQALRVTCTRSAGALTLSVASPSAHTPLSSIVGPRLRIGIVRNAKDTPGGQLSVTFHGH